MLVAGREQVSELFFELDHERLEAVDLRLEVVVLVGHLLGVREILASLYELIVDAHDGTKLRIAFGQLAEHLLITGHLRVGHLHFDALVLGDDVVNEGNLASH